MKSASDTKKQREERLRIIRENKKKENHATPLTRLKRGDDNELERNLRLEKVVASKQLRLGIMQYRTARVGHGDGPREKSKTGEDGTTAQPMFAVLSLELILKSWELCL